MEPWRYKCKEARAVICKRLTRPGIDSEDSIPPAYVAWLAGTTNRVVVHAGPSGWESIPGLHKRFTNTGSGEREKKKPESPESEGL